MSNYLKPQSPLKKGDDYIYPLTTADQVIIDGNRLNTMILTQKGETEIGEPAPINADTLGGTISKNGGTFSGNISAPNIPFSFGIDEDGNYGYYKDGADTLTPFSSFKFEKVYQTFNQNDNRATYTYTAPTKGKYLFMYFHSNNESRVANPTLTVSNEGTFEVILDNLYQYGGDYLKLYFAMVEANEGSEIKATKELIKGYSIHGVVIYKF